VSVQLPADVYSPDQVGIVLWELGGLISSLRGASTRAAIVTEGVPQQEVHVSSFLMGVLHAAGVSAGDRQALEQLQIEMQALRTSAPVAHIVLAALPNRTLKRELVEWFRAQLHPQHLVTFATRGDIGGGFVLRIGSKQYDFTYRARLLEDKHRFTEIFDGVRQ